MDTHAFVDALPGVVLKEWGEAIVGASPTSGGLNSVTAHLTTRGRRFVAKWVPLGEEPQLQAGAEAAAMIGRRGVRTGEALPTLTGRSTVDFLGGALALLTYVPGVPLDGFEGADQVAMARTLAVVHSENVQSRSEGFLRWVHPTAPHLHCQAWLRPAIDVVRREFDSLPLLTWSLLHTDPAPEAFLRDELGTVGLIDWAGATNGPVLYDVASAVMYLGGKDDASRFLDEYRSSGPLEPHELETHLDTLLRFRGAVQGVYFSRRLLIDDLTGIPDHAGNLQGLDDARRMLRALGVT